MKHLVLALAVLLALASTAGATAVCTGTITSGDTCSIGLYNITWDQVLVGVSHTASVTTTASGSTLTVALVLALSGTIDYTVTPSAALNLTNVTLTRQGASDATKQINGVSPILEVEKFTPVNSDSMAYVTAPGVAFSVTDTITGTGGSFGATNVFGFVPEPASFALIGMGLVGLGLLRRRKA